MFYRIDFNRVTFIIEPERRFFGKNDLVNWPFWPYMATRWYTMVINNLIYSVSYCSTHLVAIYGRKRQFTK